MGQIIGSAAKPKRCNLQSLSSLGTPAAGEYILVSSDNSMNAAGQGNFDCYIEGNGTTAATALPRHKIENLAWDLNTQINGEITRLDFTHNCRQRVPVNTTTIATGAQPSHIDAGTQVEVVVELNGCIADGNLLVMFMNASLQSKGSVKPSSGVPITFTPSVDIEYISLYCSNSNVVAAGTIYISLQYGNDSDSIVRTIENISNDVQEISDTLGGSANVVSIDRATNPNYPINTTTIAAGAQPVSIPAGATCLVRLTDNDGVLLNTLNISFRNSDASEVIASVNAVKDTDYYITPSANVYYVCLYTALQNVGSPASSINVSIKYPEENLPMPQKVDYILSYAKGTETKLDTEYRKSSDFRGKTCIFIGDSISTGNGYQWKGMLEDNYNLKYVRNSADDLWPANGGIPVIPPISEASENDGKSIWYRCAQQRMSIYTFDCICLFGGTNDMNTSFYPDMELGTINDTPYVDTLDGFSSEIAATLTATRPATLTYAAALMGCIEMLHRDFPTKTIILPTVLPCQGAYGNVTDASGMRLSERMAILQMQIANKYSGGTFSASGKAYGVVAVPFYWYTRTFENSVAGALSKDGVHPNLAQARSMAILFAENLFL